MLNDEFSVGSLRVVYGRNRRHFLLTICVGVVCGGVPPPLFLVFLVLFVLLRLLVLPILVFLLFLDVFRLFKHWESGFLDQADL